MALAAGSDKDHQVHWKGKGCTVQRYRVAQSWQLVRRQRASRKMSMAIARVQAAASTSSRGASKRAPAANLVVERRTRGFTLIEVLITVAVVAILAAVALPSYNDYITRSKIVEAISGLTEMRVRLEQYFLDGRQYPASCVVPASGPAPAAQIYLPASTKYFTFTCALTTTTYTVTATGNATLGMSGFVYTVDQANNRKTTSLPSGWPGAGAGSTCWITRKSGDC
jgi:type IV pilus assembly protein PilE